MQNTDTITILIIEDNPGDQLLLYENLLNTRLLIANIVMVKTLAESIVLLRKQDFSLIFLDLFLPDSTGLESFSELIKINSRTPVVIYSGSPDSEVAVKAISMGAQDFLMKEDCTGVLLEKTVRYSIERKRNTDALEESNARYDFLSKATHDMVWDWDLITNEVVRNPEGWKKIFKAPMGHAPGTKDDWPTRVHPGDRKKVAEIIEEIIQSGTQQLFEAEFRILRDDGKIGYIEDRGYVIRNEAGKAIRIVGASHDITGRKNAEEKILLSEQRFKSLVQNGSDLLAILDAEGHYTYLGPSLQLLGYDPELLIGKNNFDFIHADDVQIVKECFAAIIARKSIKIPLFRFRNGSGEWRWIERTMTNLMDDPAVKGIVANSRDVTEKKIAEDELTKLSMVAKETSNGVIISDYDQNILWVNNAFTKMFGYTLDEVKGINLMELIRGPDTDADVEKYVKKQLEKKKPFVFELINYTKSRDKIFVRVQVQPIFDENGDIKQYFALQTDITRQKELEVKVRLEKIIKQKEITDAVFAAQEKERSGIGRELHDNINQILGAVRLYIGMARKDEKSRDSLLTTASTFILTAIEEIRKLSRSLITPLEEKGLADAINDLAAEIMQVHPIHISLTAKDLIEDGLTGKFKINIFRIIQEQINNTLKHAKAKNIWIDIDGCDSSRLLFSISDDGIGFDTTMKRNGVGITNIKSRAELYNGSVLLSSVLGKGTTLVITFNKKDLLLGSNELCA
ncbi:MAG: PAS domain S-box protein [Ginsengibacter sp.]